MTAGRGTGTAPATSTAGAQHHRRHRSDAEALTARYGAAAGPLAATHPHRHHARGGAGSPGRPAEKAKAKQRKADGGRKAAPGRPAEKDEVGVTSSFSRAPQARDVAAALLAAAGRHARGGAGS